MMVNLGKGFRRLWLFFTLIWVSFCAWQVLDSQSQVKKAKELKAYYVQAASDAQQLEGKAGVKPLVSAHLSSQIEANTKIIAQQTERFDNYAKLLWIVPVVFALFCWGIPWVANGFVR